MKDPVSKGYADLADAIIRRAAMDYKERPAMRKEIERFARSDWFYMLSDGCDSEFFIGQMRKGCMNHMKVTLTGGTPEPLKVIAQAASVCYDAEARNPKKLVERLYENGHHSVFEHVWFRFHIEGISRACSHQLVRYRHASFTQRSQRYCAESTDNLVVPPTVAEHPEAYQAYRAAMEAVDASYLKMLQLGIPKEDARYVLPNAQQTEVHVSLNLRELIHLANERRCFRAQWEIRELVTRMCALVDPALRWMLVRKCESGRIICHDPCREKMEEAHE